MLGSYPGLLRLWHRRPDKWDYIRLEVTNRSLFKIIMRKIHVVTTESTQSVDSFHGYRTVRYRFSWKRDEFLRIFHKKSTLYGNSFFFFLFFAGLVQLLFRGTVHPRILVGPPVGCSSTLDDPILGVLGRGFEPRATLQQPGASQWVRSLGDKLAGQNSKKSKLNSGHRSQGQDQDVYQRSWSKVRITVMARAKNLNHRGVCSCSETSLASIFPAGYFLRYRTFALC